MEHMFGELLEFDTTKEFDEYIENLTNEDAVNILEVALSYCQKNGMFTLDESHTIYQSIKKLKENDGTVT
jgi:hypothetical protein